MTRASTVLGAAPHPRGRCAAVPPTTVCRERPFRRPERPVRPSSWRDNDGLGIGQPRGSLRAWRRRKTQRFRAPRGAAARRGSPSLEKKWLKIHQDAEATTNFEENLAFWTPVVTISCPWSRPGARTHPRAPGDVRRRYRGRTAARRRCILFYFFCIFGRARTRALPRGRLTRYQGCRK
jgi:hypothetical protein